jgi:hypothetical protein
MEVDIKAFTDESKRISNEEARCRRLRQIPASARWSPPLPWRPSATGQPFAEDATSRLGSGSCHGMVGFDESPASR